MHPAAISRAVHGSCGGSHFALTRKSLFPPPRMVDHERMKAVPDARVAREGEIAGAIGGSAALDATSPDVLRGDEKAKVKGKLMAFMQLHRPVRKRSSSDG